VSAFIPQSVCAEALRAKRLPAPADNLRGKDVRGGLLCGQRNSKYRPNICLSLSVKAACALIDGADLRHYYLQRRDADRRESCRLLLFQQQSWRGFTVLNVGQASSGWSV